MALPAIIAGLNVIGSAASAVQGNQNRQRAKGEIKKAYKLGRERLALRQGDQRRGQAESLIARGLSNGGGRTARAVMPSMVDDTKVQKATKDMNVAIRQASEGPNRFTGGAMRNPAATSTAITNAITQRTATVDALTAAANAAKVQNGGARTLGEAQARDLQREQQLEQNQMLQQRNNALAGVDAGYSQSLVNAGGNAIAGAINAYGSMQGGPMEKPDYGKGAFGVDPVSPWSKGYGPSVDSFNVIK